MFSNTPYLYKTEIVLINQNYYKQISCPFMFDIKYEGLGFAQTYGEVAIVPFIYTLPCYLCANYPDDGNYCDVRVVLATVMLG